MLNVSRANSRNRCRAEQIGWHIADLSRRLNDRARAGKRAGWNHGEVGWIAPSVLFELKLKKLRSTLPPKTK